MTYVGAPWRSRYLRSPKVAHLLARDQRFCRLGDLASVWLGLKNGQRPILLPAADGAAPALTLGSGRSRRVRVLGLNGWEGDIASTDLRPAILNPHHLFHDESRRRFTVPAATGVLYLYPQDRSPAADLGSYVAVAEAQGVRTARSSARTRAERGGTASHGASGRPDGSSPTTAPTTTGPGRTPTAAS